MSHTSHLRTLLATASVALSLVSAASQTAAETTSLRPNIHGAIRSRYELALPSGEERFQVRNARFSVDGQLSPAINYYIQTDLCDRGEIKFLDAWGRLRLAKNLAVQAGQFRMPFGTDPFRGPANYIFANRSFIGKEICSVRAIGTKLIYTPTLPDGQKLNIEAGAFNSTGISNTSKVTATGTATETGKVTATGTVTTQPAHLVWMNRLSYAGKIAYTIDHLTLATGAMSIIPNDLRINLTGGSATWNSGRWLVEGEYMYKYYTHSVHKPTHAYQLFADYHFPVKISAFNQASFQLRGEGHTPHSAGKTYNDEHILITSQPTRHRLTAGGTLSYITGPVHCDFRLNYEKYLYNNDTDRTRAGLEGSDRILAELVVRF